MSKNDQKREAMLALVEEWRESGETQAHFATKHEISFAKLQYWVRKSKADAAPEGFLELPLPSLGQICVRYPNGVELLLPPGMAAAQVLSFIGY